MAESAEKKHRRKRLWKDIGEANGIRFQWNSRTRKIRAKEPRGFWRKYKIIHFFSKKEARAEVKLLSNQSAASICDGYLHPATPNKIKVINSEPARQSTREWRRMSPNPFFW